MANPQVESATQPDSKTPYQLDLTQTTKACKVLLKHINSEKVRQDAKSTSKPDLLADNDDQSSTTNTADTPIWLILTTKKHIVDKPRLKPGKIALPHTLNPLPTTNTPLSRPPSICLITVDPVSTYTDLLSNPLFPASLRPLITRTISLSKVKSAYKSFESRRQLYAEHDIFLADDRVITYLPQTLGKVFYKGGAKRPIPITLMSVTRDADGKRTTRDPAVVQRSTKDGGAKAPASPAIVAHEIEKALGAALVHLAPGVSTAVRVGNAGFEPEMVTSNIAAVVQGLTERFVTKGWRNVRAIHVKGPNTAAFPVWLASELWVEEADVVEEKRAFGKKIEQDADTNEDGRSRKRKAGSKGKESETKKKPKVDEETTKEAQALDKQLAAQSKKIKSQKAKAMAEVGGVAI